MANLSFSKVTTVGSTGLVTGRIYFETSTGCIKVAKSATEVDVFGAGVKSASWDEVSQKLTIVNQNNEQIEVDFSDIASASSVTAELAKKLNVGTSADASTVQSYYGLKKYTDEAKSSAISSANSYTDEKIGEIPAAIVYKGDGTTITQSGSSEVTFAVGTIAQSKVSGLESALAGKAAAVHTHTKSQITDFDEADYATAAQGTKADTALQSVTATGAGNLTLTAAAKSGTTQAISGSLITSTVSSNGSGLVIASDVKSYVDSAVNTSLSSVLKYKGSCAYAELPEEAVTGDVWNVTDAHDNVPAGTNYAWNGESWDALAGSVDLSPYLTSATAASTYATKTELTSGLAGKANTSHKHAIADVTDLQSALDAKVPTTRTVNEKALSANVVIGGGDIVVGGEGDYAEDTVQEAIDALKTAVDAKPSTDTNTTYTFANGADGSFTVTPSAGAAQKVTIGKPATAGTADNATTANKVAQALVVQLNGGTAEGTSQFTFNGSAAKTVNITAASVGAAAASHQHSAADITSGTLAVARGGTSLTSAPSMLVNLASTSAANVFTTAPRPGVTGTLPIANGGTGATTAAAARTALGVDTAISSAITEAWTWAEFE